MKKFEERERDEKSKKIWAVWAFSSAFANKKFKNTTLLSQLFFPERERERERLHILK